jgi:sulfur-oxidizing protein SoxY
MATVNESRRRALKVLGGAVVVGVIRAGRLGLPRDAAAQPSGVPWNKDAFSAKTVDEVVRAYGGTGATATMEVSWGSTPEIAENGAVVPVSVTSRLPDTESIAIMIEKNPNKLAARFHFPEGTDPTVSTRVKVSESSNVHALIRTKDGKYFVATREIKVTLGGCGG